MMIAVYFAIVAWWAFGFIMMYRSFSSPTCEINPSESAGNFVMTVILSAIVGVFRPLYDVLRAVWLTIYGRKTD